LNGQNPGARVKVSHRSRRLRPAGGRAVRHWDQQPVAPLPRRTETGEAPDWSGPTTEHIALTASNPRAGVKFVIRQEVYARPTRGPVIRAFVRHGWWSEACLTSTPAGPRWILGRRGNIPACARIALRAPP
jgi:hypothetical protein